MQAFIECTIFYIRDNFEYTKFQPTLLYDLDTSQQGLYHLQSIKRMPLKTFKGFRKDWMEFFKTQNYYKISCISTSFKKDGMHIVYNKKVTGSAIFAKLFVNCISSFYFLILSFQLSKIKTNQLGRILAKHNDFIQKIKL